jgi:hypothetical protein
MSLIHNDFAKMEYFSTTKNQQELLLTNKDMVHNSSY